MSTSRCNGRFLKGLVLAMLGAAAVFGADAGPLRVGAARIDITPQADPKYPALGKYAHEHLYVRAIVIDNGVTRAAIIGADQSNMQDSVWGPASKGAAAELKCPVENIIMSSTHTHSGAIPPSGAWTPTPASTTLADNIIAAVKQANTKLQPARVGFGTGMSYLNVNRDVISKKTRLWTQDSNLDAPSDKTVAVTRFEDMNGEPIAIYVNYAMHPVNLYLGGFISADYPGAATRYIEQLYDDKAVVAFSQGASGDQNPLYLRASTAHMLRRGGQEYKGQPLIREEVEAEIREGRRPMVPVDAKQTDQISRFIESEGQILGEEVMRVMDNMTTKDGDIRIWGSQQTISCPGRTRTNQGREGQPGTYSDGPDVNIRVGVLGIGSTAFTTIGAEVYNPIGQAVKKRSPLADTVVVTLANGAAASGYIPTDDAFGRTTFQVLGSRLKPGCAETKIQNTLVGMLRQYTK